MQHLDLKTDGQIAWLTMGRAEKHAALNPRLLLDILDGLDEVQQMPSIRAVVLSSQGPSFCSGVDLAVLQEIRELPQHEQLQQWLAYWRQLADVCEALLRFPKPIIAAVDGQAIGAGFSLALACDLIVASDEASFSAGAVQRGLVGGITAALLSFRVGTSLAARMSLTGHPLSAIQADTAGLLCQSPVPTERLGEIASYWANETALGFPQAILATKRLINESIGENMLTQLAAAAADSATACTTESAGDGIEAFMKKSKKS